MAGWLPVFSPSVGQMQVNLWFPWDNLDYPFINTVPLSVYFWRLSGPGSVGDMYDKISSSGYPSDFPTGTVSGTTNMNTTFSAYVQDSTLRAGGQTWVATWDGSALPFIGYNSPAGVTLTQVTFKAIALGDAFNRATYTISSGSVSDYTPCALNLTLWSGDVAHGGSNLTGGNFSNFKFFLSTDESAMNSGQVTTALFLSKYNMWGRIRFMDWMSTGDTKQSTWNSRQLSTDRNWCGPTINTQFYSGLCTKSGNDYTAPRTPTGSPSSWTQGQVLQCAIDTAPDFTTIQGLTSANPVVVTSTSHGYVNGDVVCFVALATGFGVWDDATDGQFFTVTRIDANSYSINLNGTGFPTWSSGGGDNKIYKQVRFASSTLPLKRVISYTGGSVFYNNFINGTTAYNGGGASGRWTYLVYDSTFDALIYDPMGEGDRRGFPHDILCKVANELGVSPWVCIPALAVDDYVTQTMTYYRDNLAGGLILNIELSNEVWNFAAGATKYAQSQSLIKWGSFDYNLWYGWRFHQMMTLVDTVFSGQSSRINKIFAMWTGTFADPTSNDNRFQAPGTGLASYPISKADSIAIAPYFESNRSNTMVNQYVWQAVYGNATQKQQAIQYWDDRLRDASGAETDPVWYTAYRLQHTTFPDWIAIAAAPAPGVSAKKLCWYEGGTGQYLDTAPGFYPYYPNNVWDPGSGPVTLTDADKDTARNLYFNSPECAATCLAIWQNFVALGGEFVGQYTLVSDAGSSGGQWGAIYPNIFAALNGGVVRPLYNTMRSFNGR